MLKNDLALRGHNDGVELLIFPSTKLPVHSQREYLMFILILRSAVIMHAWRLLILKVTSSVNINLLIFLLVMYVFVEVYQN